MPLVNLSTGQTTMWSTFESQQPEATDFTWTPDGRRVFSTWARGGGAGQLLTGTIDQPAPEVIRCPAVGGAPNDLQIVSSTP